MGMRSNSSTASIHKKTGSKSAFERDEYATLCWTALSHFVVVISSEKQKELRWGPVHNKLRSRHKCSKEWSGLVHGVEIRASKLFPVYAEMREEEEEDNRIFRPERTRCVRGLGG